MKCRTRRFGFTLIEMLVVISIMVLLMGMIMAVAYSSTSTKVASTGATALVGWLKTMQMYALRDQKPYGLRLDAATGSLITTAEYLEQPPEWVWPGVSLNVVPAGGSETYANQVNVTANVPPGVPFDFSGGQAAAGLSALTWPILPGDLLEFPNNQICFIQQVGLPGQSPPNTSNLTCSFMAPDSLNVWTFTDQQSWRIVRRPRAMIGSDLLLMPSGSAVNLQTNGVYGGALPTQTTPGYYDIIFAPTGAVMSSGPSRDIKLWVVDGTQPANNNPGGPFAGEQYIVSIAVRTGLMAIHPVDITPNASPPPYYLRPYSFTQDGRSSGF